MANAIERLDDYILQDGCYLNPLRPEQTASHAYAVGRKILDDKLGQYMEKKPLLLPVMRGGGVIFLSISGLFRKFLKRGDEDVDFIPIKASRYKKGAVNREGNVYVDEADINQVLAALHDYDEAILIDDVFDKGKTLKEIKTRLDVAKKRILIATAHVKPEHNQTDINPDYTGQSYYNKKIGNATYSPWLVYHWEVDDHSPEVWKELFPDLYSVSYPSL